MPDYRVYTLDSDGHFFDVVQLDCIDDTDALKQAKQLVDGRDMELWQRDRKIGAFAAKSKKHS